MESAESGPHIEVEVVYGKTGAARVLTTKIWKGATLQQAIEHSGLLKLYPEIDLGRNQVGVFSKKRALDDTVQDGDRIEIYQRLKVEPGEARRRRAART